MVVLRFLLRSFTPTFSLYKAVMKKEETKQQKLAVIFQGTGKLEHFQQNSHCL